MGMDIELLKKTAKQMVATGKGILAADESSSTCQKRFESVGVPCTEENRRAHRATLLIAEGLDGLRERLAEYKTLGARFAKWRAVITIGKDIPSDACIHANAHAMARYAALCQEAGIVPMEDVAKETIRAFKETLSSNLAGIAFLSGGQTDEQATEHLNAMNKAGKLPWPLSFSYGRALQNPVLKIWAESPNANIAKAQEALLFRSKMNSLATQGKYSPDMEKERPY